MLTSEEIFKKIQENMEEIRKFGIRKIGLFGSYIKDEQKMGNEIDILVEFEGDKKPLTTTWILNSF
ncbi:MAG TPA: nucleotidyltransferase domain-containing protein [Methanobacterium sp.]